MSQMEIIGIIVTTIVSISVFFLIRHISKITLNEDIPLQPEEVEPPIHKLTPKEEAYIYQLESLQKATVSSATQYVYENQNDMVFIRFVVDEKHSRIVVCKGKSTIQIPFSEVIGCDTLIDSKPTGTIGRAIVGGMIAGDAGAIIGAATAQNAIMSFQIVIYRENITEPTLSINLINTKTRTDSVDYEAATRFASSVSSSIKAIISKTRNQIQSERSNANKNNASSVADELLKYKTLLDEGLLTREEFEEQKKKLLNGLK